MVAGTAIVVSGLRHCYGETVALDGVSFEIPQSSVFGFLGPNGGGKTTLFSVLSTLLAVQDGHVHALGFDVTRQSVEYRRRIGVTFQSPSLDRRLTVFENLLHQGHLYGYSGAPLRRRIESLLQRFQVADRTSAVVGTLSGGLKRRVELAKCLIHEPALLLLDEPSTGLDPGARHDLWQALEELRRDAGTTVVVTTHLMEEAERCDLLVLLDRGRIVAQGGPSELRSEMPGETLTVVAEQAGEFQRLLKEELHITAERTGETLRIRHADAPGLFNAVVSRYRDRIREIGLSRPTLEDVFMVRTGRTLSAGDNSHE